MSSPIVCVFCGANSKLPRTYEAEAFKVGAALANNGFALATGGGKVGLMKQVIEGHASTSSQVTRYGVIPLILKPYEPQHHLIPVENIIWTNSIHGNLENFASLGEHIIVLPGGFGTLHELIDCLVHNQFGLSQKHIYLYNLEDFWDPLLEQFKVMVKVHALEQIHLDHLIVVNSLEQLLHQLKSGKKFNLAQGFDDQHWL
jgi:uncharacterized protein (TIGR00730 family)